MIEICTHSILWEDKGMFTSPGYPGVYQKNKNCSWHIVSKLDRHVELHVHVEAIQSHPSCAQDAILVRIIYI